MSYQNKTITIIKSISFIIITTLFLSNCDYKNKEELYKDYNMNCDTTSTNYSGFIKPLVTTTCGLANCHAGQVPAAGLDLTEYNNVKQIANNGSFINRITLDSRESGFMPQGGVPLTPCEIDKIKIWINKGARNN